MSLIFPRKSHSHHTNGAVTFIEMTRDTSVTFPRKSHSHHTSRAVTSPDMTRDTSVILPKASELHCHHTNRPLTPTDMIRETSVIHPVLFFFLFFFFFFLLISVSPHFDFSHGKFGSLFRGKASCNRVARPYLRCMLRCFSGPTIHRFLIWTTGSLLSLIHI